MGVQGIPSAINFNTGKSSPIVGVGNSAAGGLSTEFVFTTQGYPNSSINGTGCASGGSPCGTSAFHGVQVLWPVNTSTLSGFDNATVMVEDFYAWAGQNDASIQNHEWDVNSWKKTGLVYLGASMQCSLFYNTWQYSGQNTGWISLNPKVTHDCPLPTGTLTGSITSSQTSGITFTPLHANSPIDPETIALVGSEEIYCATISGNVCSSAIRGWAGTTPAAHSSGAAWEGSVHVQFHVSFAPGNTTKCVIFGTSTPAECVFVDYLNINNHYYGDSIYAAYAVPGTIVVSSGGSAAPYYWGTQTISGVSGGVYSAATIDSSALPSGYPDRIANQFQVDVSASIGTTASPVAVSEFIDRDNVTGAIKIVDGPTTSVLTIGP